MYKSSLSLLMFEIKFSKECLSFSFFFQIEHFQKLTSQKFTPFFNCDAGIILLKILSIQINAINKVGKI